MHIKLIFTLLNVFFISIGYSQWNSEVLKKNNISMCCTYSFEMDSSTIFFADTIQTNMLFFDSAGNYIEYKELNNEISDVIVPLQYFYMYDNQNRLKTVRITYPLSVFIDEEYSPDTTSRSIYFYDSTVTLSSFTETYKKYMKIWDNVTNEAKGSNNEVHTLYYSQDGITAEKTQKFDSVIIKNMQRWQFSKNSEMNLIWEYTDTIVISTTIPPEIYLSVKNIDNHFDSTSTAFNYSVQYERNYISVVAKSKNGEVEYQIITSKEYKLRTVKKKNKLPNGLVDSQVLYFLMEKHELSFTKYVYK